MKTLLVIIFLLANEQGYLELGQGPVRQSVGAHGDLDAVRPDTFTRFPAFDDAVPLLYH